MRTFFHFVVAIHLMKINVFFSYKFVAFVVMASDGLVRTVVLKNDFIREFLFATLVFKLALESQFVQDLKYKLMRLVKA